MLVVLSLRTSITIFRRPMIGTQRTLRSRVCISIGQCAAVLVVSGIVSVTFHVFGESGFFADGRGVGVIQAAHLNTLLPRVGAKEIPSLIQGGAVVVDARLERDYEAGHLDSARNIPVGATKEARLSAMGGIASDRLIILYCQSSTCPYAINVARSLREDGYAKLLYFKGGWREWVETYGENIRSRG